MGGRSRGTGDREGQADSGDRPATDCPGKGSSRPGRAWACSAQTQWPTSLQQCGKPSAGAGDRSLAVVAAPDATSWQGEATLAALAESEDAVMRGEGAWLAPAATRLLLTSTSARKNRRKNRMTMPPFWPRPVSPARQAAAPGIGQIAYPNGQIGP